MPVTFTLPAPPAVPVEGQATAFPVGRVFCVGRNYAAHAREMGGDAEREPPFFFSKFADAVVPGGGEVPYPPQTCDYHYEGELVIAVGAAGAALTADKALDVVFGYATGLDMTRRDLQSAARDQGRPWFTAKTFARSAPIAAIRPVESGGHAAHGAIRTTVNGEVRQDADVSDMIWGCADVIAYLSAYEALKPGDLIFTGTPAGVGPVKPGDTVEVSIEGLQPLQITVVAP